MLRQSEVLVRLLNSAVVAAVVGALVGGLASWLVASYAVEKALETRREEERREREQIMETDAYTALLFGRDIVFLIHHKRNGDELAYERAVQGIREYLKHFQLIDVGVPSDPTADDGAALLGFVNTVAGRLQISNHRAAAGLLLAWNGLLTSLNIDQGNPPMIHEYAEAAGFPPWDNGEVIRDYLTRLENRAEEITNR